MPWRAGSTGPEPVNGMTDLNKRDAGRNSIPEGFAPRPDLYRPALYSRFVSAMKYMLPVIAGAVLVIVVVYSGMFDREARKINQTGNAAPQSQDIQMANPKVTGVDTSGRPYVVTAEKALQSNDKPGVMALDKLQADLKLDDKGNWVSASSPAGVLDTDTHMLTLSQKFDVYTSWGYEFHGTSADIDFKQGTLRSSEPVHGHGPSGTLAANSMAADQNSDMIHFVGDVKVTVFPAPQARKEK